MAARRFGRWVTAASVLPWVGVVVAHHAGAVESGPFVMAGLLFGAAHVGTTVMFYGDPELDLVRQDRRRYLIGPLVAIVAALALLGSGVWLLVTAVLLVQQVWQIHHFTRQNLGVFALYARARGGRGLSGAERRIFDLTSWAGMCGTLQLTMPNGYRLPAGELLRGVSAVLLLAAAVLVAKERPMPDWRLIGLSLAVMFYVPLVVYPIGLVVATSAYGFAHGAQYLVMMGHLRGGREHGRRWLVALGAVFVLVGLPTRWLAGQPVGLAFAVYTGLVVSHFIVDAGVWKMRDPDQRAYLTRRFSWL